MNKLLALSLILFGCGVAQASPVTWTFTDATFDDGTKINGSFVYDASNGSVIDIDISTEAAGEYFGRDYAYCAIGLPAPLGWQDEICSVTGAPAGGGDNMAFIFTNSQIQGNTFADFAASGPGLTIVLDHALTNAGGSTGFVTGGFLESYEPAPYTSQAGRIIVSGSLTAVPVPAAVWFFGSAVAGLGWFRRRPEQAAA